jgi:uncharacterized protein YjbI with pentapeptide repeats
VELVALKPLALDTLVSRTADGAFHLTIIAKLAFDLTGALIDPEAIRGDVLNEGGRSLRVASDFVPRRARADVTFAGTAHSDLVRVVVAPRAGAPLLDKTLRIVGAPVAVTYEHAFGGGGSKTNPVGTTTPQILDATHDKRTAGLGPVPSTWWWRSQLLGEHDVAAIESLQAIPRDLDFAFFNAAPPDQQIRFLAGDETIVLSGLVPEGDVRCVLPGLRAHARFDEREVALVADALFIDGDARRVTLTFRGQVAIDVEHPGGRVVATLAAIDEEPSWGLPAGLERARGRSTTTAQHPPRTTEHVPVVNVSGLVPFTMHFRVRPPRDALIVVVKGTFDLVEGAPAKLAETQQMPSGDARYGDVESLRYSSDFVPFKPRADVFLVGHAYPGNDPTVAHVHLQLDDTRRSIAVFGDRAWDELGAQTKAATFTSMPLRWERALGGPLSDRNPVGRGQGTAVLLPNLERLDALVVGPGDTPEPICFAPIDPEWRTRRSKLGTYNKAWLAKNWPYFPDDFEWSYFNAAQMQLPWLRGDERYALFGVTPGGGTLSGRLPALQPRAFAAMTDGRFVEVVLRIDTVHFDADARQLVLVHRGLIETNDTLASEVSAIFVLDENEAPVVIEEAHERYLAEVKPKPFVAPKAVAVEVRVPPPKRKVIESWLTEGLAGRDLTGGDLRNLDLTGKDLRSAILTRCDLRGSKLAGANLEEVSLVEVRADGVDFRGANLSRADLTDSVLDEAGFEEAVLTGATFAGAQCKRARFSAVLADGVRFVGSTLDGASFERAQLSRADFTGASLRDASFANATLPDAKLYDVRGPARFDGASMRDARLDRAELAGSSFVDAVADAISADSTNLERANLLGAGLKGALLIRARLAHAVLSRADLRDAILRGADLTGAKLLRANAMGAMFDRTKLDGADLRGANLFATSTAR